MIAFCCDDHRRSLVRRHATLNGIDRLEVVDLEEPVRSERQRTLRVWFVKPPADVPPFDLLTRLGTSGAFEVRITGGERVTDIRVDRVAFDDTRGVLEVHVEQRGDYSTYTLALTLPDSDQPLDGLDPELARVDFSFKVDCPSEFDCRPSCACPSEPAETPEIDYLAKDYASFRQLMLDRMSLVTPGWTERHAADLGITLVEALAYVGDHLSYAQDAIAQEAYLGTAHRRVSVRRHARLLDYSMHDGCNARVWIQIRLTNAAPALGIRLPRRQGRTTDEPIPGPGPHLWRTRFTTAMNAPTLLQVDDLARLLSQQSPEVFEPMEDALLYPAHNEMKLHSWGRDRCCLPRGAVKATLLGHFPHLGRGDVLILAERLGPRTGVEADADPVHRQAVRLTRVQAFEAAGGGGAAPHVDPVTGDEITEVEWGIDDALRFPLCLSAVTDDGRHAADVSVALGNVVLADHGLTVLDDETLGSWPKANRALAIATDSECGRCEDERRAPTPPRWNPALRLSPVTQAAALPRRWRPRDAAAARGIASASSAFAWDPHDTLPAVRLGDDRGEMWRPRPDLLSSDAFAPEFVVEVENDGRALIRFGDDQCGMRPGEGMKFWAAYRIGNGTRGNVGAESIAHVFPSELRHAHDDTLVTNVPWKDLIDRVTNPLPAGRGRDPETLEEVRNNAPAAFSVNQRCVTPEDYAARAGTHREVQSAAATLRWTGSWHTVFLTVDRLGGRAVDDAFEQDLRGFLEPYRMAGHDLEIDGPRFVALELDLEVCVRSDYFRADVRAALEDAFSSRARPDGTRGFFHADHFTFGQAVYPSRIYEVAQSVPGVREVEVTRFRRLGTRVDPALTSGVLEIDRLEIARLDNDANFPDRGVLRFVMKGGK